jgi:hypothetical protein
MYENIGLSDVSEEQFLIFSIDSFERNFMVKRPELDNRKMFLAVTSNSRNKFFKNKNIIIGT